MLDVTDIAHPKSVAWYEPEYGGVHNVWVAGDTLYMGAYNAGFRVFDISGELRGDLRAQEREIGAPQHGRHGRPREELGDDVGRRREPKTLAYVNDDNNGLWIMRIEPKPKIVP